MQVNALANLRTSDSSALRLLRDACLSLRPHQLDPQVHPQALAKRLTYADVCSERTLTYADVCSQSSTRRSARRRLQTSSTPLLSY
jgi:hypothetical protein